MAASLTWDVASGYELHVPAWRFYADDTRFCLATAGRRGAKTYTGARRFLRKIAQDYERLRHLPYDPGAFASAARSKRHAAIWWQRPPRLHYMVLAEVGRLLKEPKKYIMQFLPAALVEHTNSGNNQIWLRGDILIEFVTAHDPKRNVGSGLNGIWVEEAARARSDAWQGFIYPMLSDKQGWAQFTTTPLGEDWTFSQLSKKAAPGTAEYDPEYSFHTWRTVDNTCVPALVVEAQKAKKNLPPAYYRREYEASYDAFEGQIYEDFDEDTMCFDKIPDGIQFARIIGTEDWGFTAPGAQVVLAMTTRDPNTCHVWAVDEVYDSNRLVENFWVPSARLLMRRWKFNEWVADPAEPDNIERMKHAGIRMVGHKNYTKAAFDEHERSVRAGIRALTSLIFQRRFHVTRKCPNLIAEIKSYRWESRRGSGLVEVPAGGQKDHAVTAARYGVSYALKGATFGPLSLAALG